MSGNSLQPVYYKNDLKKSFGCSTDHTLIKRLTSLKIPYIQEGKDIYVLYEDIKERFKTQPVASVLTGSKREEFLEALGL